MMRAKRDCEELHAILASQIAASFEVFPLEDRCFVATPMLGPDNSEIGVEVSFAADGVYHVSDGGAGAEFLFLNGVSDPAARLRGEDSAIRFGLSYERGSIVTQADEAALGRAIFDVAQAALDMEFYREIRNTGGKRSRSQVFNDEVLRRIAFNGRQYETNVRFRGKVTGSSRVADICILPREGENGTTKQLALFPISGESEARVRDRLDKLYSAYRDVEDDYRIASVIDTGAPGIDVETIARSILGDYADSIIPFSDGHRFDQLIEAA